MAQEIADSKLLDTWGSSGTKIEPDISKIIEGWQLGEQPPHEYMNWLQNTFGSKLNHILKNGVAIWNNETEYLAGASVQHSGSTWLCETTNTNSEPTDLNANWEKAAINKDLTVTVDTLADLKNISYPANTVWASGYHTKNDGAFGSHIFRLKGVKTTETNNGGTVIIASIEGTDYVYELQYYGAVNVKWFGAKGDGVADDTISLNNLSLYLNTLSEIDIEFNKKDTYLISYNSSLQKDDYSSYIFNLNNKNKISIKGNGATVKLVDHNISTNKGFTFTLINNSNNIECNNFIFDFTFTGVNTSSSYYPQCSGFRVIGTCKNVNISDNRFSMFHPFGQMALSGTNYNGDTNNGFKIIPIAVFGDVSETNYMNLTKNVNILNNVFLETHNGYGIWVYAVTDVVIESNKALKWVGKSSDQNGNIIFGSFSCIRYIQFYGQNVSIINNTFNSRDKTDRPVGYEGACNFIALSQNITTSVPYNINVNVYGNSARIEATENTISGSSYGIYLMLSGRINIDVNTLKVTSTSDSFPTYAIKEDNGLEYDGITRDIIINGNFIEGVYGYGYGVYLPNSYSTNTNKMNLILSNNKFDGFVQSVSLGASHATHYGLTSFIINGNTFINQVDNIQLSNNSATAIGSITNNLSDTGPFIVSTWTLANKSNIVFSNNKYSSLGSSITQDNTLYQTVNLMKGLGAQFSLYTQNVNGKGFTFTNQEDTQYIFSTGEFVVFPASLVLRPYTDNNTILGSPSYRWSNIYSGTGTINTSDDREKTYIDITEVEKKVALELKANMKKFKFNSSIKEKGRSNARIHFGASAQTVKDIFEKYGLNGFDYALLCYDEWEEKKEVKDDDGTVSQEYIPAGNRYGLRYEELLCFIMSAL